MKLQVLKEKGKRGNPLVVPLIHHQVEVLILYMALWTNASIDNLKLQCHTRDHPSEEVHSWVPDHFVGTNSLKALAARRKLFTQVSCPMWISRYPPADIQGNVFFEPLVHLLLSEAWSLSHFSQSWIWQEQDIAHIPFIHFLHCADTNKGGFINIQI